MPLGFSELGNFLMICTGCVMAVVLIVAFSVTIAGKIFKDEDMWLAILLPTLFVIGLAFHCFFN